jgi:hypothetical protein
VSIKTRQQLRQLGKNGRDTPRLVAGEQMCRRAPSWLVLEIDIRERVPIAVAAYFPTVFPAGVLIRN